MKQAKYYFVFAFCIAWASLSLAGTGWFLQPAEDPEAMPEKSEWTPLLKINTTMAMVGNKPYGSGNGSAPEWTRKLQPKEIENVWYRKTLEIPEGFRGRSVWLDFPCIEGDAILWINGKRFGEVFYPDWELNITDFVEPGKGAELLLYVTRVYKGVSRSLEDDRLTYYALRGFGRKERGALGLVYEPILKDRGYPAWIRRSWVESDTDAERISIMVEVEGDLPKGAVLAGTVRNGDDIFRSIPECGAAMGVNTLSVDFKGAKKWALDAGNLYDLELVLMADGKVVDAVEKEPFGYRDIRIEGNAVLINGVRAPFRMHSPSHLFRGSNFVDRVKAFGVNVFKPMDNALFYYGVDRQLVYQSKELLSKMDQEGLGVLQPLPYMQAFRTPFPFDDDPELLEQYCAVLKRQIDLYRSHPSVLGWIHAINVIDYNTYIENLSPPHLGIDNIENEDKQKKRGYEIATGLVNSIDPSRFAYGHAGGNMGGDLCGLNAHMNFIPLAEKEAWYSEWAAKGDKPVIHDEGGGFPLIENFYLKRLDMSGSRVEHANKSEPVFTEYCAEFYGDFAYETESELMRRKPWAIGVQNINQYGVTYFKETKDTPMPPAVRRYQIESNKRVNRAWRTWQVQGWFPWTGEWGYRWQNPTPDHPAVAAYRETMQPLLAYIGGAGEFYRRDRNYSVGEEVRKCVVAVFDGPEESKPLKLKWEAVASGGEVVAGGEITDAVQAGSVRKIPFSFAVSEVDTLEDVEIRLSAKGEVIDTFGISIFPEQAVANAPTGEVSRIQVYGEVDAGFMETLKSEDFAHDAGIVVIGRNGLQGMEELPYTAEEVKGGLRVVLFEQQPEDLLRLGLRNQIWGIRQAFVRVGEDVLTKGFNDQSLADWRGSATLRSDYEEPKYWSHRPVRMGMSPQRPARWGNHGNVVTVMIETPTKGNFRPLVECGFDLAYSPLLEWRHGKGRVLFCQLDVTGRTVRDPAAKQLKRNIVTYLAGSANAMGRRLDLSHVPKLRDSFEALGFAVSHAGGARRTLPVLPLNQWSKPVSGPSLFVPQGKTGVAMKGVELESGITRDPVMTGIDINGVGIGPGLQRWRAPLDAFLLNGRILGGSPSRIFCGVALDSLAPPYADEQEGLQKRISHLRIRQLYQRLLASVGVISSDSVAERITTLNGDVFEEGDSIDKDQVEIRFGISNPVRQASLSGATLLDALKDEVPEQWQDVPELIMLRDPAHYGTEVDATSLDLAHLLQVPADPSIGVLLKGEFKLDVEQEIGFLLKTDWWSRAWLDGELLIDLKSPVAGDMFGKVQKKLAAGIHRIRLEVVSGNAGFKSTFYIKRGGLGEAGEIQSLLVRDKPKNVLLPYNPADNKLYTETMEDDHDPYMYKTW